MYTQGTCGSAGKHTALSVRPFSPLSSYQRPSTELSDGNGKASGARPEGLVKGKWESLQERGASSLLIADRVPDQLRTKGKVGSVRARRDPTELMRGPRLQASGPGRELKSPGEREVPGASSQEG